MKHYKWIKALKPDYLDQEVYKFKEILIEATFIIRALFFLLFRYLIETSELTNQDTMTWAGGIVAAIFLIRFIQLVVLKIPVLPLLFIAPRGLITILLFLQVPISDRISIVGKPLIIQVIILTGIVLMLGMMFHKKKNKSAVFEKEDEGSPI